MIVGNMKGQIKQTDSGTGREVRTFFWCMENNLKVHGKKFTFAFDGYYIVK